jgi:tetratricopeptide (TPR) repeat protein
MVLRMASILNRHIHKITSESLAQLHRARGDKALANKIYSVAFRAYMQSESYSERADYTRPCQLALNNHLNKAEYQELLKAVKNAFENGIPRASLHYGLLCNHQQDYEEAITAYGKAILLGVEEARELMNQVIRLHHR